jgi:ferredoxin--NADP+ reductase
VPRAPFVVRKRGKDTSTKATADLGTDSHPLRVAIIGAGPAGFYAAMALLKQKEKKIEVDLFDRLPTPYGLVRGGVAPDHENIKAVMSVFDKVASTPGFRFFGNVRLGRDIAVADLTRRYHQILYTVGNEDDRPLGIPGAELAGCTPATVFVGWYNAHPDHREAAFDFRSRRVAVVGNGNVAVDVARMLARQPEELTGTDIADYALEALRQSRVEEVVLLGRRGPLQAAFSPAELKELTTLPHADAVVDPADIELDGLSRRALDALTPNAPERKNYQTLVEVASRPPAGHPRRIRFRFLVSPVELVGDAEGRIRRVRLERNELHPAADGTLRPRGTGRIEDLEIDWIFPSIGYRGRPISGVPFDEKKGVIANDDGRVLTAPGGEPVPGQYVAGWAQSGPRGLIGMHKAASAAVVAHMTADVEAGRVPSPPALDDPIDAFLAGRGVDFVTYRDWKVIERLETERGRKRGAPRCKFGRLDEMLAGLRAARGD